MPLKPIVLKGEQKRVLFLQVTYPIQIKGVAGSGKTTVALYRAKHLVDTQSNLFQEANVAIFTYNKTLVKYINAITPYISGGYQQNSDEIKPTKPKGINVTVTNFHKWAYHFIQNNGTDLYGKTVTTESQNVIIESIVNKFKQAGSSIVNKKVEFFIEEISWIKGKAFENKEEYIEAKRVGRGTNDRVNKSDKEIIWKIYLDYNSILHSNTKVDFDDYALMCIKIITANQNFQKPFSHIVIDEAQDLSKAQILVLSKIVSDNTRSISIIADAAQRIYKSGFTWNEVGLNVRGGRTIVFETNYRNTIPIVKAAISLLSKETENEDFTEVKQARRDGEKPKVGYFKNWDEQCYFIHDKLNWLIKNNIINSTVILHRNNNGIRNIKAFLESKNFSIQELKNSDEIDFGSDSINLCTLTSVKGLEFDNVFIIDLNENVIPYPPGFNDENDDFHISTERRLLYTAMTRARERLFLLSSGEPTRYLSEIDKELLENIESSNNKGSIDNDDDLPF